MWSLAECCGVAVLAFTLACVSPPMLPAPRGDETREAANPLVANYGETAFVHVTEADMPLRVAIGIPRNSPRYGSREAARNAAVEGIRAWELAIRPHVSWFEIDVVEADPEAAVQVEWKRRTTGSAQGRAGPTCERFRGKWRVGGRMEIAIRESPTSSPLALDQVRLLVAHEFGHVLGLGHCLECDSAMNYAWHTQERILVTDTDVRAFRALLEKPNACREPAGSGVRSRSR